MRSLRSRNGKGAVHQLDKLMFTGIVAKVDCPSDKLSAKTILLSKLEEGGAQIAQRLKKDVTHIVFVKQGDAEDDLKRIDKIKEYERKNANTREIMIVSPLWVDECLNRRARICEGDFYPLRSIQVVSHKRDREFLKPPPLSLEVSNGSKKHKRSNTPRGGIVPKPLDHFEIDHSNLDSARKLRQCKDFEENSTQIGQATQDAAVILASNLCNPLDISELDMAADDIDTPLGERCSRRMSANEGQEKSKPEESKKGRQKKKEKKPEASQRFSLRRLFVYPERPVLLDKNLPEKPVTAKPVLKKTVGAGVPIPEVERVSSPWGTPHGRTNTIPIDCSTASKRGRCTTLTKRRLPSPWSTLRPWDLMKKRKSLLSENIAQPSPLSQSHDAQTTVEMSTNAEYTDGLPGLDGTCQKTIPSMPLEAIEAISNSPNVPLSQEMLSIPSASQMTTSQERNPSRTEISGMLAVTSVKSSVLALCKIAVEKLPGLKLWANNSRKNKKISHLIIGDSRRTLKTMLAVLHGAYLLRPEYVTASLEAGYWLPEEDYLANVIFQEGSTKARQAKSIYPEGHDSFLLLGRKVSICSSMGKRKHDDSYQVIRRICQELGATLFHISDADICIVIDDDVSSRPPGIPAGATAVRKEWLFQSVCEFRLIEMDAFIVT